MEEILDDLHDAVWTSIHINAEGCFVLEFTGPYRMRRWLTIAAQSEPDLWMTEGAGLPTVGTVWRLRVAEVRSVPTDEVPEWREVLIEKTPADAWILWFVANVGNDFAVVTREVSDYSLVDCVGWD
ncbi:MAG: hypothetical protein IT363_01120 [Methanoregulaceae archaeon]|nr:hypothetical protein [Methanoregulaceae archaeon]